jgi:predicted ATPase
MQHPRYLAGIRLIRERVADFAQHPFSVPCVQSLDLSFSSRVTFLVGENGSGKTTLLEAVAALCRLPVSGTHSPARTPAPACVAAKRRPPAGRRWRCQPSAGIVA